MVERELPQPPPDRLGFEGQARSPLDEARYQFVTTVWANNVHLIKLKGLTQKVFDRQNGIVYRCILNGESEEDVAQEYKKDINWVDRALREGLKRLRDFSPEELRGKFSEEMLFMTRDEKAREARRSKKGNDLASQLGDPNLSKVQLKELVPKVGRKFFESNRHLFDRLESLLSEADQDLLTSGDLSPIAEELERDGGIVLFSFSTKAEVEGKKVHFLVLKHDRDAVLHDLRNRNTQNTQKDLRPHPSGLIMYQSF